VRARLRRIVDDARMFDGFEQARVDVGDGVQLRVRHGGSGKPVVLLHGHPRTHNTMAPRGAAAGDGGPTR